MNRHVLLLMMLLGVAWSGDAVKPQLTLLEQARAYWFTHGTSFGEQSTFDQTMTNLMAQRATMKPDDRRDLAYAMWSNSRLQIAGILEAIAPDLGMDVVMGQPGAPAAPDAPSMVPMTGDYRLVISIIPNHTTVKQLPAQIAVGCGIEQRNGSTWVPSSGQPQGRWQVMWSANGGSITGDSACNENLSAAASVTLPTYGTCSVRATVVGTWVVHITGPNNQDSTITVPVAGTATGTVRYVRDTYPEELRTGLPNYIRTRTNSLKPCSWATASSTAGTKILDNGIEWVPRNCASSIGTWAVAAIRASATGQNYLFSPLGMRYTMMSKYLWDTPRGNILRDRTIDPSLRAVLLYQPNRLARYAVRDFDRVRLELARAIKACREAPQYRVDLRHMSDLLVDAVEASDDMGRGPGAERRIAIDGSALLMSVKVDALRSMLGWYLPGLVLYGKQLIAESPDHVQQRIAHVGQFIANRDRLVLDLTSRSATQLQDRLTSLIGDDSAAAANERDNIALAQDMQHERDRILAMPAPRSQWDQLMLDVMQGSSDRLHLSSRLGILAGSKTTAQGLFSVVFNAPGALGANPDVLLRDAGLDSTSAIYQTTAVFVSEMLDDWDLVKSGIERDPTAHAPRVPQVTLDRPQWDKTQSVAIDDRESEMRFLTERSEDEWPDDVTKSWYTAYSAAKNRPDVQPEWLTFYDSQLRYLGGDELALHPEVNATGTTCEAEAHRRATGIMSMLKDSLPILHRLSQTGRLSETDAQTLSFGLGGVVISNPSQQDARFAFDQMSPDPIELISGSVALDPSYPNPPMAHGDAWESGSRWQYWRVYSQAGRIVDAYHQAGDILARNFWHRVELYQLQYQAMVLDDWRNHRVTDRPGELEIITTMLRPRRMAFVAADHALRGMWGEGKRTFIDSPNPHTTWMKFSNASLVHYMDAWNLLYLTSLQQNVARMVKDTPLTARAIAIIDMRLDIQAHLIAMSTTEALASSLTAMRDVYRLNLPDDLTQDPENENDE